MRIYNNIYIYQLELPKILSQTYIILKALKHFYIYPYNLVSYVYSLGCKSPLPLIDSSCFIHIKKVTMTITNSHVNLVNRLSIVSILDYKAQSLIIWAKSLSCSSCSTISSHSTNLLIVGFFSFSRHSTFRTHCLHSAIGTSLVLANFLIGFLHTSGSR